MQIGPNTSTLIDGWLEAGRGSDTALITADDQPWTANELYRAVCNVAARFDDAGIGREDRVLLVLDDTPAFPAVFLGAMRIGAIPVPVNFLARPDDFGYFLDDSQATTAVVDHAFLEEVGPQVAARPDVKLVVANGATNGAESLDEWMASDAGEVSPVSSQADDMAFWMYSSGSTGPPKSGVHRHSSVAATWARYAVPALG
ncbi:MAG: AMP-binding protein, partial [Acidimicrobiia bacterium]